MDSGGVTWLMADSFCSRARDAQCPGFGCRNILSHHLECPQIHKSATGTVKQNLCIYGGLGRTEGVALRATAKITWGLCSQSVRRLKCLLFLAEGHDRHQGWWQSIVKRSSLRCIWAITERCGQWMERRPSWLALPDFSPVPFRGSLSIHSKLRALLFGTFWVGCISERSHSRNGFR